MTEHDEKPVPIRSSVFLTIVLVVVGWLVTIGLLTWVAALVRR